MFAQESGCLAAPGVYFDDVAQEWYVTCTGCGARADSDPDRQTAIDNWNASDPCSNESMQESQPES